ncbi:hypothetical protein M422DRAFT_39807 [Sphaerobolus stellatus SS14]|uniref:Uncharacterized protein n=1 Tax=Sphaerobolus stellatus (strain SS14) TaxID=990650 RepID=A0A0C9TML5_SPHS4|nr:hypothetical protein M422DRAFT_39807 [Sphaerobolus stellatus SS14]
MSASVLVKAGTGMTHSSAIQVNSFSPTFATEDLVYPSGSKVSYLARSTTASSSSCHDHGYTAETKRAVQADNSPPKEALQHRSVRNAHIMTYPIAPAIPTASSRSVTTVHKQGAAASATVLGAQEVLRAAMLSGDDRDGLLSQNMSTALKEYVSGHLLACCIYYYSLVRHLALEDWKEYILADTLPSSA